MKNNKKVYIDCFGVFSINACDAIKAMEEYLESGCTKYDFLKYGARSIKAKPDEYGYFLQGKKTKKVLCNFIKLHDTEKDIRVEETKILLTELIRELNK